MSPEPMTPERLAAITQRLGAATPGEWGSVRKDGPRALTLVRTHWEIGQREVPHLGVGIAFGDDDGNARLMAHAPADLRACVTALTAAPAREQALREEPSDGVRWKPMGATLGGYAIQSISAPFVHLFGFATREYAEAAVTMLNALGAARSAPAGSVPEGGTPPEGT